MDDARLPIHDTNAREFLKSLEVLECIICLQPYGGDRPPITLPKCHHLFHYHCIEKWTLTANTTHNQCPACRSVMFEDEDPLLEDAYRTLLDSRSRQLEEELERLERFVFAARSGHHQDSSSFDDHDALNEPRTQSTADSAGPLTRSQTSLLAARTTTSGHDYSSIALSDQTPVPSEATPRRVEYLELSNNSTLRGEENSVEAVRGDLGL